MRSALRRMGNSTGLIIPKPVLQAAGVESGTVLDLSVEDGRIVAIPLHETPRAGWAEAARTLGSETGTEDEAVWRDVSNESDDAWTW